MICANCGIEIDKKTMRCPKCGRPAGNAYAHHTGPGPVFPLQPPDGGRSQGMETPSYKLRSYVLPLATIILCAILTVISVFSYSKVRSILNENREAANASSEEIRKSITAIQNDIRDYITTPSMTVPADGNISENPEEIDEAELIKHIFITEQPNNVLNAQPGQEVVLSIKAEGNDLEYQWFKWDENKGWVDPTKTKFQGEKPPFQISPDNNSDLIINTSPEESEGLYQCKITSSSTPEDEYSLAVSLQYVKDSDPAANSTTDPGATPVVDPIVTPTDAPSS